MKDTVYVLQNASSSPLKETISYFSSILTILVSIVAIITFRRGIRIYNKQRNFDRLQNLSKLFQRFTEDDDFMAVFTKCDEAYPGYEVEKIKDIEEIPVQTKLKYTALLEDVALHAKHNEVDRQYAVHLFQWHFYYLYNNTAIANAFWGSLGGLPDGKSWGMQMDFAKSCNPVS